MNEYDALRKKNIAERNAVFAEFFSDLKKQKSELKELKKKDQEEEDQDEDSENQPPRKRRRRTVSASTADSPVVRRRNVKLEFRKKYNTRSRTRKSMSNLDQGEEEGEENERRSGKSKLRVLFPWAKPFQREIDLMKMGVCDVDEEEEEQEDSEEESDGYSGQRRVFKVNKNPYDPNTIPSVDEITEEMLANVAEKSSLKTYCKMRGTSCHQCRQKTIDTKTVCRSGECIGVRGQFCGPCLRGRYGESAVEALKDPDWSCPPCRGLCNCSICRTRSGLRPTGILAPIAQEEGFQSVKDYLQSAELES